MTEIAGTLNSINKVLLGKEIFLCIVSGNGDIENPQVTFVVRTQVKAYISKADFLGRGRHSYDLFRRPRGSHDSNYKNRNNHRHGFINQIITTIYQEEHWLKKKDVYEEQYVLGMVRIGH